MKALVYQGPGRVEIVDQGIPQPGPEEVLVAVRAAGVCGSDVHGFTGVTGRRAPGLVMGHEAAGEVVAHGEGVDRPRRGSRVALFPIVACGRCPACWRGQSQQCPHRRVLGVDRPGAFAEYVVVPARNCRPIGRRTPFAHAALAEPLAVGLHATALAGIRPGEPVAVLGAGGIGLCAVVACHLRGAGPVYVTDLLPERLAVAEALGAVPLEARPGDGGLPPGPQGRLARVIDTVGTSSTLEQALVLTSPGGRVVVVGMGSPEARLPVYELITQERVLVGSYAYTAREYDRAVRHIARRRVDMTPLIGRTCGLEDLPEVFPRLARGEITSPRVVATVESERAPL